MLYKSDKPVGLKNKLIELNWYATPNKLHELYDSNTTRNSNTSAILYLNIIPVPSFASLLPANTGFYLSYLPQVRCL